MNDPVNLSLYSELIRFQVDLSRSEVRFSHPDNLMQRTLQELAHRIGLEYEYFLSSREARMTRVVVSTTFKAGAPGFRHGQPMISRRGSEQVFGGSSTIDANGTPNRQPVSVATPSDHLGSEFKFDGMESTVDELPTMGLDFDWSSYLGEQEVEEPDVLLSGLQRIVNVAPELPGGQDLLQYSGSFYHPVATGYVNKNMTQAQSQMGERFNSNYSWQGVFDGHSSPSAVHNDQLSLSSFSTAPLSMTHVREDLSASLSDASLFSSRQAGSRAGSISSIQSSCGRSRVSKILSRKSSIHRLDNSAGFQEFVFDSRPASRHLASSGRHGPLGATARAAMKAVAAAGACWRCKFLRKQAGNQLTLRSF